jgi:hypothetical protein
MDFHAASSFQILKAIIQNGMTRAHLNALEKNFDFYFLEEMKKLSAEGLDCESVSGRHDDRDIDKGRRRTHRSVRRRTIKLNFNRRKLTQFWLSVQQTCPTLSIEALKVLLPFSSSYICEVGFSAMVGMKTKFRNKLHIQYIQYT